MIALVGVQTTDAYPTAPSSSVAWLAEQIGDSNGGYAFASGDCIAQILYGDVSNNDWSSEFLFPKGGLDLDPGIAAIRFRSKVPGTPVTVSAALFREDEPAVRLAAGGLTNLSLTFQHNGGTVANEPILNFVDTAQELTWTTTDNSAAQTLSVSLAFTSPTVFPGSVSFGGTTDNTFGRLAAGVVGSATSAISSGPLNNARATIGAFLETGTGRVLTTGASPGPTSSMFATAIVGDVQWRWTIDSTGAMTWGTGAAAGDTTLFRSAAVPPSSGQVGLASSQAFYSTNTTGGFIFAAATNNSAFLSFFAAGDANPAFKIFTQGAMVWGVGGATAPDIEFARSTLASGGLAVMKLFPAGAGSAHNATLQTDGNYFAGFHTSAQAATSTYTPDAALALYHTLTFATAGGTLTLANPTNPPDSAAHTGLLIIRIVTSATAATTMSYGTQYVAGGTAALPATIAAATEKILTFAADYTTGSLLWRLVAIV